MVKYKEAGIIMLILGLMASLGVNLNNYTNDGIVIDEGYLPYACAKETVDDMYCYKLSKIGTTGVNRNCYYDRERGKKYKVCSTGWERIQEIDKQCTEIIGFVVTEDEKWYCRNCGTDGCEACISNEDIELNLDLIEYGNP